MHGHLIAGNRFMAHACEWAARVLFCGDSGEEENQPFSSAGSQRAGWTLCFRNDSTYIPIDPDKTVSLL